MCRVEFIYKMNSIKSLKCELDNRPIPGTVIFENNMKGPS